MDKVRVAKELVKLAKSLVAQENTECYRIEFNGGSKEFDTAIDAVMYMVSLMKDCLKKREVLDLSGSNDGSCTVISLKEVALDKAFDTRVKFEKWCVPKPGFNGLYEDSNMQIEVGVYREEDGSYTLQVFDVDDVVLCETIDDGEYDADHAAEWMEKHPHGWYNSESDYGTGDEDE